VLTKGLFHAAAAGGMKVLLDYLHAVKRETFRHLLNVLHSRTPSNLEFQKHLPPHHPPTRIFVAYVAYDSVVMELQRNNNGTRRST